MCVRVKRATDKPYGKIFQFLVGDVTQLNPKSENVHTNGLTIPKLFTWNFDGIRVFSTKTDSSRS